MRALKLCVVLGLVLAVSGTAGAVGVSVPYTFFKAENWGVGTLYGSRDGVAVTDKPASQFTPWDGMTLPPPEFWKILPPGAEDEEDSWGVFRMLHLYAGQLKLDDYIEAKYPDPYWQIGSSTDEEILGVFYGGQDQLVSLETDGSMEVTTTGFTLELHEIEKTDLPSDWWSRLRTMNPALRSGASGEYYDFLDGTIGSPLLKATTTNFWYVSEAAATPDELVEGTAVFYSNNIETYSGDWTPYLADLDHYDFVFADSDFYLTWDTDAYDAAGEWMYHSHDEGSFGAVPEPMTMLGVGVALGALGGYIRRRRRA